MSNVPQDLIDDARAAVREITGDPIMADGVTEDDARLMLKFLQLRAQRSNAEPVAIVNGGVGGARLLKELPPGTELYTAQPDYAAGVAAGMMKAAEICDSLISPSKGDDEWSATVRAQNQAFNIASEEILSAIPADSKAALREVCMKVAIEAEQEGWHRGVSGMTADLKAIVNSVLEGKS